MERIKTDVAIIGGGASGLAAAIAAAETNPSISVVIAERLDRIGRKLLVTGSGRCNLSNKNLLEKAYHGSVRAMEVIRNTTSAEDFFGSLGVLCTADEQGRMYHNSNSAATVLNALRLRIAELGVREECGFEMKKIEKTGSGFIFSSGEREIECSRVIVAAGGYAAPSFGTDGSVMRLLKSKGYKTAKIYPAVAPLRVKSEILKGLKGVRVKGRVAAVSGEMILHEENGEIQFTDNTISGICVFNLAHFMAEYEGKLLLRADFIPDMSHSNLEKYLRFVQHQRSRYNLEELLTGIFTKNLAVYITKRSLKRPLTEKISELNESELHNLAQMIKSMDFEISGCSPWQNSQATAGGIHGSCVDENLQSRTE